MLTIFLLLSDYANGWSAGGITVPFPAGAKFLFEKSRLNLMPAQLPVLWVLGLISLG